MAKVQPSATAARSGSFAAPVFALGVLNGRIPIWASDSFPEGIKQVYAVFDYRGLRDGQRWRGEWYRDGVRQDQFTTDGAWNGGGTGAWWVKIFNPAGLSAGDWQFRLYLEAQLQQTSQFTIELNPSTQPAFGPIVFAAEQKNDAPVNPVPGGKPEFPADTKQVYAFFDAINVPEGTVWSRQWFRNDGADTDLATEEWSDGPNDSYWVRLSSNDNGPLGAGVYVLEIGVAERLVSVGSFVITAPADASARPTAAPLASPTPRIETLVFAAGVGNKTAAIDARSDFPSGTTTVYAIINTQDFADGAAWRSEWLFNGQVITNLTREWKFDAKTAGPERRTSINIYDPNGLAAGEWQLNIYVANVLKQSGRFTKQAPPTNQPGFSPLTFAPDKDAQENPLNPLTPGNPIMPAGVKRVYVFFKGINVPENAKYGARWVSEGKPEGSEYSWNWSGPGNGSRWVSCTAGCFGKPDGASFDPGVYEVVMRIEGRDVALGTFIVPK